MAQFNLDELNKRVAQKLISVQKHPDAELYIYNYTPQCQYTKAWDDYTLAARGLILDNKGEVIARPFSKFFNYSEHLQNPDLPKLPLHEEYRVLEKMDGSLGILYWHAGKPWLATRGSFTSEQALMGSQILQERYGNYSYMHGLTYLFEIIYPQNRIVVDYGDMVDIVLIAINDTQRGTSYQPSEADTQNLRAMAPFPIVQRYELTLDEILQQQRSNAEGYVLLFKNGMRCKIKHDEYVRLHRILTGVSSKTIWELLRNHQDLNDILEATPDEFYDFVMQTVAKLKAQYLSIEDYCKEMFDLRPKTDIRRDLAVYVTDTQYPSVLWNMIDGKDYEQLIWKYIKPKYEQPFKKDIDA